MSLSKKIKQFRIEKGYTQYDLATRAKISPSHISHIEQGFRNPQLSTLRKIADALNVAVKDLIDF